MDNYQILQQICQGSQGNICKVKRLSDKKIFISKELNYSEMSEKQKQQLIQEVNILRELKHPNIVRYFDRFQINLRVLEKKQQKIFIIMEYCEKGDMQKLIDEYKISKQQISEKEVWKYILQICLAINEIHNRKDGKILHRDIKPANIFIDEKNNIRLGDFGFSKLINDQQFAQTGLQNIHYLAPEQINENIFSEKTDIWAFACLIYELINLEPPFQGSNQMQVALKITQQKIEKLNPNYSAELQRLIFWGLEKDYRKRPSVEDILNMPEISFHLREKRVKDNQILLQKRQMDLQQKINQFEQKEIKLSKQLLEAKQRQEEVFQEKQKILKIYQDSLKDYETIIQQQNMTDSGKQKNVFFRNNSQDLNNNKMNTVLQKDVKNSLEYNENISYRPKQQIQIDNQFKNYKIQGQKNNEQKDFSLQFIQKLQNLNTMQSPQNLNSFNQQTHLKNKYLQRPQTSKLHKNQ